MDILTREILGDVTAVTLLALALGLVVFWYLRQKHPERRWQALGNVYTEPYSAIDMVVVGLILLLFLTGVFVGPDSSVAAGAAVEGTSVVPVEDIGGEGKPPDGIEIQKVQLAYSAVYNFMILGMLLMYLTVGRGLKLPELFGFRQMSVFRAALVALAVYLPIVWIVKLSFGQVYEVLVETLPEAGPQPLVKTFLETESDSLRAMIIFSAVVVAPVFEEAVFRGFIYPVIKRHTERLFAAVITGLFFGIIHYHVPSLVPLAVLGTLLALAYELSGSLWVPVFLHAIFNGTQTIQMMNPGIENNWWWIV